jgi:ubiquinone/menaquinone biosynthesis C-methylase UbiE
MVYRWPHFVVRECSSCGFRFVDTSAPEYPRDAQYIYDEPGPIQVDPELPHIQRRVRDILRWQRPPGRALDIGCGKGEVSLALAQRGFQCTGLDMKERIISHLQREQPSVRWLRAMTDELEKMGEQFDVISMYHVLEHITDPVASLKGILRLARAGALAVIEVPNVGGLEARIKGRRWHYYKVDHVTYFRPSDLRRIATLVDADVLEVRGYQHFSHPQNVLWKDVIKGAMASVGFRDVLSVFLRVR